MQFLATNGWRCKLRQSRLESMCLKELSSKYSDWGNAVVLESLWMVASQGWKEDE